MYTNPYESPMLPQESTSQGHDPFQVLAGTLAIGGILWGMFCLPFMVLGHPTRTLPIFGPGYLLTVAYVLRWHAELPLAGRRLIWAFSMIVQGTWLVWFVLGTSWQRELVTFEWVCLAWWAVAFCTSAYALVRERRELSVPRVIGATNI